MLEAITAHHFHLGEIGSAVAMKLIDNTLVAIHTLAAAEAMNLGVRAGFNPHRVAEVIRQGAGNSTMFTIRAPMMAARSFSPAPGPFNTLHKYLEMGEQLANELGCVHAAVLGGGAVFLPRAGGGMDEEDISAVIKLLEAESRRKSIQANRNDHRTTHLRTQARQPARIPQGVRGRGAGRSRPRRWGG